MPKKKKAKKEKRPGPGAPPTLTPELIARMTELVKHGNYIETAYGACGVPKTVFYEWMTKGQLRKGTIYAALTESLHQAMSEGETRDVLNIERAAFGSKAEYVKEWVEEIGEDGKKTKVEKFVFDEDGRPIISRPGLKPDWKASAWRLERRNRNKWGRTIIEIDPLIPVAKNGSTPAEDADETVSVDPYSIKAILDKIRSEY